MASRNDIEEVKNIITISRKVDLKTEGNAAAVYQYMTKKGVYNSNLSKKYIHRLTELMKGGVNSTRLKCVCCAAQPAEVNLAFCSRCYSVLSKSITINTEAVKENVPEKKEVVTTSVVSKEQPAKSRKAATTKTNTALEADTYYSELLKSLLSETVKGFGIGAAVSIVLVFLLYRNGTFAGKAGLFGTLTILIGAIASILLCARGGSQRFMSSAVLNIVKGIIRTFFSGISGGTAGLVFGIVRLCIGLIVMIPVGIYMVITYCLNLLYLIVMSVLEKLRILSGKKDLCDMLDKLVAIVSLAMTIVISVMVFRKI